MNLIVFTDLDGTLLDVDSYGFEGGRTAIARIKAERIPLILCTSKTRREVEVFEETLGISEPFVVENGGGIYIPAGYRGFRRIRGEAVGKYIRLSLGRTYREIRRCLSVLRDSFGMRGFGDMSAGEVARMTGLSLAEAGWAKDREHSEPFLPSAGTDRKALSAAAAEIGLRIVAGGRFLHLMDAGQDKGKATRILMDLFLRNEGRQRVSVGLGDSPNDLGMLRQVRIPVAVPRPDGRAGVPEIPGLIRAPFPGSRGWGAAVESLLSGGGRETASFTEPAAVS